MYTIKIKNLKYFDTARIPFLRFDLEIAHDVAGVAVCLYGARYVNGRLRAAQRRVGASWIDHWWLPDDLADFVVSQLRKTPEFLRLEAVLAECGA